MNQDSWNARLYDQSHSFVSMYGNDVMELLSPEPGERILDLGCGTGDLAKKLFERGVHVIGIDKSESMVEHARAKYPVIEFLVKDATALEYENIFDAVFSNATLHWVKPPEKALEAIYQSLKWGGRFVAEFGGKGNVQAIISEIIKQITESGIKFRQENYPWFYPSIGEYSNLMENIGFQVVYAAHFDRPTPLAGIEGLRNWIDMFGQSLFEGIDQKRKDLIIGKVEEALEPFLYKEGHWEADYKRIRVYGIK